jgi:hypothetical protein
MAKSREYIALKDRLFVLFTFVGCHGRVPQKNELGYSNFTTLASNIWSYSGLREKLMMLNPSDARGKSPQVALNPILHKAFRHAPVRHQPKRVSPRRI